MDEQNGVLAQIGKVSGFLSQHIAELIIITSVIAFYAPKGFLWIPPYTATLLGAAMFGMGLTIKREDFQIVFSRPKEVFSGCLMQYTVMPLVAYFLAVVMNLDKDIALGVILVGCCPGGTASNVICYLAKGDIALSVAMTGVSTLLAPFVTPALVYLLAGKEVAVDMIGMFLSIVQVVIVPIVLGLAANKYLSRFTERVTPLLPMVSTLAIATIIGTIVSHNSANILSCSLL